MRDVMWSYAVILLWFCDAWSQSPGPFRATAEITNTTLAALHVVRNLSFNQGRDVNLSCSNKTWDETLFVSWNISLEYKKKNCLISFALGCKSKDTCQDGKSLRNTSSSQSYLNIPNFSHKDVGVYRCHSPFKGGNDYVLINLTLTVPPKISLSFEHEANQTVAVCRAEEGNPAANISWSPAGNSTSVPRPLPSGLYTVESRLVLSEGVDKENLSCIIRHPCWEEEKVLTGNQTEERLPWLHILSVVLLSVFLALLIFIAQKKLRLLRPCQPSMDSSSKSPPREEVEEVEPYASYIQRENTIYNSSADLFA